MGKKKKKQKEDNAIRESPISIGREVTNSQTMVRYTGLNRMRFRKTSTLVSY